MVVWAGGIEGVGTPFPNERFLDRTQGGESGGRSTRADFRARRAPHRAGGKAEAVGPVRRRDEGERARRLGVGEEFCSNGGPRALFFAVYSKLIALAVLNEIVWRTQTTDLWVKFKTFGFLPLTLLFALAQALLIMRNEAKKEEVADNDF